MVRKTAKNERKILIGTSGYSYGEWVDAGFYPSGIKSAHMLAHYAGVFPVTELNFTWYQMPKPQVLERMRGQVPPGFRFAAKLTRTLTHEIVPNEWRGEVARFREGITPLLQSRQLTAVLVQLAPFFDRSPKNRRYLADLFDELAGLPLAVEFRHRSWADDRVFTELSRRKVTLVTVDAPDLPYLFPALDVVTNPDLFYVRLHGRNARGWRSGNMQKKFDYSYNDEELGGLSETISHMARQALSGVVFFNNHVRGQAVENARQLDRRLRA
jgi:uncharacterized protein YecE (DUF72 family)